MDKQVKIGRLSIHNFLEQNESFIVKDSFSDTILFLSLADAYDIIEYLDQSIVEHEQKLGIFEEVGYGN